MLEQIKPVLAQLTGYGELIATALVIRLALPQVDIGTGSQAVG